MILGHTTDPLTQSGQANIAGMRLHGKTLHEENVLGLRLVLDIDRREKYLKRRADRVYHRNNSPCLHLGKDIGYRYLEAPHPISKSTRNFQVAKMTLSSYESNALQVQVPAVVFSVLCPLIVALRIWGRTRGAVNNMGIDDWTILGSLTFGILVSVLMLACKPPCMHRKCLSNNG